MIDILISLSILIGSLALTWSLAFPMAKALVLIFSATLNCKAIKAISD